MCHCERSEAISRWHGCSLRTCACVADGRVLVRMGCRYRPHGARSDADASPPRSSWGAEKQRRLKTDSPAWGRRHLLAGCRTCSTPPDRAGAAKAKWLSLVSQEGALTTASSSGAATWHASCLTALANAPGLGIRDGSQPGAVMPTASSGAVNKQRRPRPLVVRHSERPGGRAVAWRPRATSAAASSPWCVCSLPTQSAGKRPHRHRRAQSRCCPPTES
jgi:hypothetical protein